MDSWTKALIVKAAQMDAVLFTEECPGEVLGSSAWDSAAWENYPMLHGDDGAWDLYRAALHTEVKRLVATTRGALE